MKQHRIKWIAFFLIALSGGAILRASAAPLNFSTAESITLSSYPTTLTIATSSVADALTVNATSVAVTLSQTTGGNFTLLSPAYDLSVATSSGGGTATISCSGGTESAVLSQITGSTVYTITPSTQNCANASAPVATVPPVTAGGATASTPTATGGGESAYILSINGGAATTATTSVTLSLYGTGAYTMEVSNSPAFIGSAWVPYATALPWALAPNPGVQTVYAQFKSVGGTVLGSAQASIDFLPASPLPSSFSSSPSSSQSSSLSSSSLLAELQSLESQLAAIQAEANGIVSSTAPFVFTRNLYFSVIGNDVKQLQLFLVSQNSGSAARKLNAHGTTEYFGTLTQNALIEFQKKAGIKPAVGYFGSITRKYVNRL